MMSLDKGIASGKEHRKEYKYAKSVDRTCRNHGGRRGGAANQCPWCLSNRTYRSKKLDEAALQRLIDFFFVDYSRIVGEKYKRSKKND